MDEWRLEPAHDLGKPLAERALDLRRESGLVETCAHLAWAALLRVYFTAWHRLRVEGREHLPASPPFVVVANHSSHLDAFVLSQPLRWRDRDRAFPIAAGDVFFDAPIVRGFAAFVLNALPLWRRICGRHALATFRARLLEERCIYIIFPEGTRSRTGEPGRFRAGLGMLVAGTDVPVVPCHIDGAFRACPPGAKFPRPRRLTLRIGAPIRFDEVADDRDGWATVAAAAEAAVTSLRPTSR